MKFEIGKFYKTRDGRKAECLYIPDGADDFPMILRINRECFPQTCCVDGSYGRGIETEIDLISEWREPIKIEGWVNVYEDRFGYVHKTRKEADEQVGVWSRLACIKVSGVEE